MVSMREYEEAHKTIGCRITHMLGVPLLLLAPVAGFFDKRLACEFLLIGFLLQWAGHIFFERNLPAMFNSDAPLDTVRFAIIFVLRDWKKLLTTGSLAVLLFSAGPAYAETVFLEEIPTPARVESLAYPEKKKKLWLPLRVVRAVLLVPFRVPAYCRDVVHEWAAAIHYQQIYYKRSGCYQPLWRVEEPSLN